MGDALQQALQDVAPTPLPTNARPMPTIGCMFDPEEQYALRFFFSILITICPCICLFGGCAWWQRRMIIRNDGQGQFWSAKHSTRHCCLLSLGTAVFAWCVLLGSEIFLPRMMWYDCESFFGSPPYDPSTPNIKMVSTNERRGIS